MSTTMMHYYQLRAPEYEGVYAKPERQADLHTLREWLAGEARGLTLLEIACGTGYWTSVAATTAKGIVATDFNLGPLEIARSKSLGTHVSFSLADAFALPDFGLVFDGGMAHFWWSHVALADQQRLLGHFASKLRTGAKLLMIDNNFVAGSMTPISRTDALGNTYQLRRLGSGGEHEVLKNFPSNEELHNALSSFFVAVKILQLQHYWAVSATLA